MQRDEATHARIADDLYAGIEDDAAWSAAISRIGEAVAAEVITLHTYDHRRQQGVLTPLAGLDPDDALEYQEHYGTLNVWVIHGKSMIRPGEVTASHLMYPNEKLLRTEFYNDWLRRVGMFSVMSAVLGMDGEIAQSLSFCRGRHPGDFSEEERAFLHRLIPHLERTARLRNRLALAGAAALDAPVLERLPMGVVLLDDSGSVLAMNSAAQALLAQQDGLSVRCGRLTASHPAARRSLAGAVGLATRRDGSAAPGGTTIRVPRPSMAAPFEIWVTPIDGDGCGRRGRAVVFIADPDRAAVVGEAALRTLYGFTTAEARVAAALLRGGTSLEVAAALGISAATVRTHLKGIMRKTGAARQSELVQRILVGVAPLVRPPSRAPEP